MPSSADLGRLSQRQWEKLQDCAERFEQAWQEADPGAASVPLDPYLPPRGDALRIFVLHELIKTDLEIRWRRGQPVSLEQYLEKYPELGRPAALPPELIFEEYRIRQAHGDKPPLERYETRFPEQFAALQELADSEPIPTSPVAASVQTPPASPAGKPLLASQAGPMLGPLPGSANQVLPVGEGYKMLKRLGSGTFGEVWLAEAPGGIQVAVKVISRPLDQEEAQRELQALELIKQLRHPYLVQTQAYSPMQDRLLIVMELADGSLRDRLKECRAAGMPGIPLDELIRYFGEAAEALDFLHSKHVHHRDIKPENILLVQKHAKVADFGLARTMQSQRNLATATSSGTPAYMAPEVWRGKVSEHSDQYSLAVTYAELRLNRRLFAGTDMIAMMEGHLQQTPDLEPLLEPERKVLLKALSKSPDERYGSCKEFLQALKRSVASELRETSPDLFLGETRMNDAGLFTDAEMGTMGALPFRPHGAASATEVAGGQPGWRSRERPRRSAPLVLLTALIVFSATALAVRFWPKPVASTGPELLDTAPSGVTWTSPDIIPDKNGKNYYRQVEITRGGMPVRFCVVPQETDSDPPTFYLMENKVWNDLFARFTAEQPEADRNSQWRLGGLAGGKDVGVADGQLPVLRVSVDEAHQFAKWLGGLLPTAQQWDRAAGCYDGQKGPFLGDEPWNPRAEPPEAAVHRADDGPLPVGLATRDISPFGCRDMAGNGTEWTRNTVEINRWVPIADPKNYRDVYLRGRSYADPQGPIRFMNWERYDRDQQAVPYNSVDPYTGFRVALEPGPAR